MRAAGGLLVQRAQFVFSAESEAATTFFLEPTDLKDEASQTRRYGLDIEQEDIWQLCYMATVRRNQVN